MRDPMSEASEALWRLTVERSPIGMALVDPAGRVLSANVALAIMLGHAPDRLRDLSFTELTHPDDVAIDQELFEETLRGDRTGYRLTKRYVHADGHTIWGDLSVSLLRDDDGQPQYFISQILDVTEQRDQQTQLNEALRTIDHQRRTAQAVLDTVDTGLVLLDEEGRYQAMNRRHADFMRLAFPDGHRGRAGQEGDVYAPDGVSPMSTDQMPTSRAARGEEFDDVRMWIGRDPAGRRALSVSARAVRDADGRFMGAALSYHDITEVMRALQVKDEFVSSVSHELRTPLTAVLGHLEMLLDFDDLPSTARRQLQVVARNADRLQVLVADLLHIAGTTTDGLTLEHTLTDPAEVAAEALEAMRPAAAAAGVRIDATLEPGTEAFVDRERLRQVIDNLLSNAVKYTDADKRVALSVGSAGDQVVITVTDEGIGIPDDEQTHLFDRFFRGDEAQTRQTPGAGLGLNIVQHIVEAHGGTVTVTSTPGLGSRFEVRLPRRA